MTWVGHATVLVEVDGLRILTDPALTRRLAHLRRRRPEPDLGPVDVVLVSHLHMDHLHLPSLRRVATGARLVVPHGAAPLVAGLGAHTIHQVRAGDQVVVTGASGAPVHLDVVPANHSDRRGVHSRLAAAPVGYVVREGRRSVYFAGDTDLFDEMRDLAGVHLALLPIWGWGSSLGERHLDPGRAAEATTWIDPVHVAPIHWGTYSPVRAGRGVPGWFEQPLAAFSDALGAVGRQDRLVALRPGGTLAVG